MHNQPMHNLPSRACAHTLPRATGFIPASYCNCVRHSHVFTKGISVMIAVLLIAFAACATESSAVNEADLAFGRRQVEQVVCDRPDMGPVLERNPELRETMVLHFAGKFSGSRMYWENREPESGQPAEHYVAYFQGPVMIRVSRKIESAIDKCASLLFELNNLEIDDEYRTFITAPIELRKSRDDFIKSCLQAEFLASKRTQAYFLDHPLAGTDLGDNPYYDSLVGLSGDLSDYIDWLNQRDENDYDPRQYFGEAYDALAPSLNRGEYKTKQQNLAPQ